MDLRLWLKSAGGHLAEGAWSAGASGFLQHVGQHVGAFWQDVLVRVEDGQASGVKSCHEREFWVPSRPRVRGHKPRLHQILLLTHNVEVRIGNSNATEGLCVRWEVDGKRSTSAGPY